MSTRTFIDDGLSICGCASCGGPAAAENARFVRGVRFMARQVKRTRPDAEPNRTIEPDEDSRFYLGQGDAVLARVIAYGGMDDRVTRSRQDNLLALLGVQR